MSSRGHQANVSSPQSSCGGLLSHEGTPNTELTVVTPEDPRDKGKRVAKVIASSSVTVNHDPFVTTSTFAGKDQKLSATATAFRPAHLATLSSNSSSIADEVSTDPLPGTKEHIQQVIAQHAAEINGSNRKPLNVTSYGMFSTDAGISRCFKVTDAFQSDITQSCAGTLENLCGRGVDIGKNYRIVTSGQSVYVRMPNVLDAGLVFAMMKQDHPSFVVDYISPVEFGRVASPDSNTIYSAHEGQVILEANYPAKATLDVLTFEESLHAVLSAEGELYAWQKLLATEAGSYRMVAEFVDSSMALRAVKRCNGKTSGDIQVNVRLHTPDIANAQSSALVATTPTRVAIDQTNIGSLFGQMSVSNSHGPIISRTGAIFGPGISNAHGMTYVGHPQTPLVMSYSAPGPHFQRICSPATPMHHSDRNSLASLNSGAYSHFELGQSGLSPSHYQALFSPGRICQYTPQSSYGRGSFVSPSPTRRFNNGSGRHNHVDIGSIQQGIDVRTTVMLRNIPNKVDQQMLKSIVDESSHGRYDFMYLRIDFSNNCNVGYAFINFVDPLDIIDFVIARSNQKWFKSEKVAEVSYATIQGRDCLIQKFRNSSVMLEPAHFRPKLFFTINDPFSRAGEEEEFPASDNASKLRRSCENAEHVGLFAPSAGQNMREEQRRRRSQYDRGTSLAAREEYGYDESDFVYPRAIASSSRY